MPVNLDRRTENTHGCLKEQPKNMRVSSKKQPKNTRVSLKKQSEHTRVNLLRWERDGKRRKNHTTARYMKPYVCCSNCTKNKKYLPITWPACIITWLVCITELWSLPCMNNCCWVLQMAYHACLILRLCACILQLSHIPCKYFDFGKARDPSVHRNPLLPRGYQGCMLWHDVGGWVGLRGLEIFF